MIAQPKPRTAKLGLAGLLAVALAAAVLLPMARGKAHIEEPQFIARLSNGVTAELVGVCHWPTGEPVCWKPNGTALDRPLHATKSNVRPRANDYGFMLRVTGPDDLDIRWNRIEGAESWEGSCDVVTADAERLEDCTAAVAHIKEGYEQTALRIGFAAGPWTTVSTHDGTQMSIRGGGGVLWSQAFADSGRTCIVATAEWIKDRATRIIAIDTDGVTHAPPSGSVALGNMSQVTTHFPGLRPDQVREFQYQVRACQWAEFSNVSLSPAHQTVVIVEPIATGPGQGGADVAIAPSQAALRLESAQRLAGLGRTLLIWANNHDGAFADGLDALKPYLRDESIFIWAKQSAEYVGKGARAGAENPAHMPLIYWKNPPAMMDGTAVAFFDGHVEIVTKTRLERLGIKVQPQRNR